MSVLRFVLLPIILAPVLGMGQAGAEKTLEEQQQAPLLAEPYQGGWSVPPDANETKETKSVQLDEAEERSAGSQLDALRWERNVSLARNAGAIPVQDRAHLVDLALELNATAPNTFEAHMANYYTQFPAPAAFEELDLASAKDQRREELIAPQLANAARKDDKAELMERAKDMKVRGRIAPPLYKVAEDIMSSVEPGAVLFAAGEMDAYPLWVEQFANGKHTDMLVVDERLLADAAYRKRIWEHTKARGAVPGEAGFIASLSTATDRPIFLSLALGPKALGPLKDKLYVTGLAMRLSHGTVDNIPLLEARWDRLKKPLDAGPLSKNYLVPGAVLLTHYRAIGDEARASRLEHELRAMAERLGATSTLVKSGIFQH
ncbi:MAG: hypothetical protein JNM62_04765 [Flavobacteriales bacterium]|nr:hypothetical protein [Flavobacteriales bacterium]